jgi:hypothetical protein
LGGELILFEVFIFGYIFLFYSFDALESGVVVAKEHSDSVWTRFQLLRNTDVLPPIDGLPVQAPLGLDTTRHVYLFEKIRDYYHEETMDITCPAPKLRAGQKQAHIDSLVHAWCGRNSSSLGASSQSSGLSAVPLCTFIWLSPNTHTHMPYVAAAIDCSSLCPASLPLIACT